jgi:hypothetical protein
VVQSSVVPYSVAASVLEAALGSAESAENLRADPPRFDGRAFLKKLNVTETNTEEASWTPDLIRLGMAIYAGYAQEPVEEFIEAVRTDLEGRAEESMRAVQRLEREERAISRLLNDGHLRKQTAKLLPTDGREERITRYERHLHNLLSSTLHELERLQARRSGESVPPPAVADVNVTVVAEPG